jgi:hypothetical protein
MEPEALVGVPEDQGNRARLACSTCAAALSTDPLNQPGKRAQRMHSAIDEALPQLRALIGELRTDGYAVRADALEAVASSLASSRSIQG